MDKEDWNNLREDKTSEALIRFKKSLVSGRKNYFDVSEFESIVEFLLDEGDIKSSEIAARQGMQIHPEAVPLQLKYAQVLITKEKFALALEYLQHIQQVEPSNPEVYLLKGAAHLFLGKATKAEKSFNKAIKYAGNDDDEIFYNIGTAYVQAGEIDTAVIYFEKSLILNPQNEFALYDHGFFCDKLGLFEKSIKYYNNYLDLNPYDHSIWYNLGLSYYKAEKYEKAIEANQYALALNDDFDLAMISLGNAYANSDQYEKAIEAFSQYLERNPDNLDVQCYLGECYLSLKDFKKAKACYRKALKKSPDFELAWFGLGLIMWLEDKLDLSITYLKKSLAIDNSHTDSWITLARVYYSKKLLKKSVKTLNEAVELGLDNAELWLVWAEILMDSGDIEEAIDVLYRGLTIQSDVILKYRLAGLLFENNQDKEGVKILDDAMAQDLSSLSKFFEFYPKLVKQKKYKDYFKNILGK